MVALKIKKGSTSHSDAAELDTIAAMENEPADQRLIRNKDGTKTITVEEFDRLFDDASDEIDDFIDWESARMPGFDVKRVTVKLPQWMIGRLDSEAKSAGVSRQEIIKIWLAERLGTYEPAMIVSTFK